MWTHLIHDKVQSNPFSQIGKLCIESPVTCQKRFCQIWEILRLLVEAAAGEELPVRRECDAVDWLLVPGESVDTRPSLHVPQPHCGVKAGGGQDEVHVGVVGARTSGTPLQIV